jgi:hypothetical protein
MKTRYSILFVGFLAISSIVFAQSDFLSETNVSYSDSGIGDNVSNQPNPNMLSLDNKVNQMDVLALTQPVSDALSFSIVPGANGRNFSVLANYQVYEGVEYAIYDSYGSEVSRQTLSNSKTVISMNGMDVGTYILHIYISADRYQVYRIKIS